MDNTKAWYESKTVWGGIIAIAFPVLNELAKHYHLMLPDQEALTNMLADTGTAVGGLLAVWGRLTASKSIGPASNDPSPPQTKGV